MVIIDAGHGGTDSGGGSNQYWLEKDLNLKISLYQYERFKTLGVPVTLTRDSDITLDPTKRIEKVNSISYNSNAKNVLISNHVNIDYGNLDGAEIIYSIKRTDTLPKLIAANLKLAGQNLSINGVYQRLNSSGNDYYYIIRNTPKYESMIIEYGFADSKGDDINLLLYNYMDLAEAVIKSICEYLGYKYDAPSYNYVVKSGDTLYKIANEYNTTISELKSLNNLTSDFLSVGQKLIVPGGNISYVTIAYVVKSGDTLYKIATYFNTTIDKIMGANQLTNSNLNVGMTLNIPTTKQIKKYTVKSGDTLYNIAKNNMVTVNYIIAINNLTTTYIYPGMVLLI